MEKVLVFTIFTILTACVASFHIKSTTSDGMSDSCNGGAEMNLFTKLGNKYYFIEPEKKLSWFGAAHFCRTNGLQLATLETPAEWQALSSHLISNGYTTAQWFWLSGNDLTNEGKFDWLGTGQPMLYNNWSAGQPDNAGGNENCVHLWRIGEQFLMNDWICTQAAHYICEADSPKTISFTIW